MSAYNYHSSCIKSKGSCGAFTKPRQPVAGLYSVKDLKLSVEDHIKSLNLHTSNIPLTFFNERTIIENRIGSLLNSDGVICAKHRNLLSIYWKSSSTCQHPNHKKENDVLQELQSTNRVNIFQRNTTLLSPLEVTFPPPIEDMRNLTSL